MKPDKFRDSLINASTPAETRLLQTIDAEPLLAGKCQFQVNLKPYFVDFYLPSKKLVVEVDGSSHQDKRITDKKRSDFLIKTYGVRVIRVSNSEVFNNPKKVIGKILRYSGVKAKIKNRNNFYGINPLAFKSKVNKGVALKEHRRRNSVAKRAVVET